MGCRGHFAPQAEFSGWNTEKVLIVASFEGDDEKAQYASFKHIFI